MCVIEYLIKIKVLSFDSFLCYLSCDCFYFFFGPNVVVSTKKSTLGLNGATHAGF